VDYFSRIITSVRNYFEALKPRETFLITFLGISSSVIAGGWGEWGRITIAGISILLGSAGVNGLTNYLDRELDAKMERTRRRPLPSKRI
jgi:protoheme IX farnesyltransferase